MDPGKCWKNCAGYALTWDMLDALRLTVINGMSIALCCWINCCQEEEEDQNSSVNDYEVIETYFRETYLPIFIIVFLLTGWKAIFFLEAADLTAVSPKFINLFYRHKLSSWSGFKIFNYCFSAQSGQSLFNIMTTSLPRSTKNSKIAAKLDFQKDPNYKGQGKEGGWTLDFQLTGNPTFLTSKLPSLQSDKSGFPSLKLFRTPQLLSGRKCRNQNGRNVNICLIFWFWKQCWETSQRPSKIFEQRTRLKFFERIHTPEGLPIMILHNARSGSRFKWYLIELIKLSWRLLSWLDSLLFSNIAEVLYFRGWQHDDPPILLTYCWKRETGGVFANIPTCWPTPRVCSEYVKKERNPFIPNLKWSLIRFFSSF